MMTLLAAVMSFLPVPQARRGFVGEIIGWFIRVIIYDIILTTIQDVLGVSRMVALFIFLGIMLAASAVAYVVRQKSAANVDGPDGV
jgi:hypothetical protein